MAQPGGTGPVGPYPPSVADDDQAHDEYDRLRRRVLWTMPTGLYVIGSTDKAERRNGMTANWVTQVSFDPKWIAVSVERTAVTHELIEAGGVFSVCVIDREDRAIVRKFTKPVEVDLAREDAQRLRVTSSGSPARRSSPSRCPTSTARCASRWPPATTRCSSAR